MPTVTLDARSLLLAGAERVADEGAARGRYWFERTRTFEPVESGAVVARSDEFWYDGRDGRGCSTRTSRSPSPTGPTRPPGRRRAPRPCGRGRGGGTSPGSRCGGRSAAGP
nr:hypothetical protein GCM10020093_048940 [Planobispora longispora]